MSRKDKKIALPYGATSPKKSVSIGQADPESYNTKSPVWSFRSCDQEHDRWSLCHCENIWNEILAKMVNFETMTWHEIITGGGRGSNSHQIEVEKLTTEAQKRLTELKVHESQLFSLRLTGKKRLFGVRYNQVLHIIWYDPEHEICPSIR